MSALREYLTTRGINDNNYDVLEAERVWNAAVAKTLTTIMGTLEHQLGKAYASQMMSTFIIDVTELIEAE